MHPPKCTWCKKPATVKQTHNWPSLYACSDHATLLRRVREGAQNDPIDDKHDPVTP